MIGRAEVAEAIGRFTQRVLSGDCQGSLDPDLVWLSHTHEPWRPPTGEGIARVLPASAFIG